MPTRANVVGNDEDLRRQRRVVGTSIALVIGGFGILVPKGGDARVDHDAFLRTIQRMRAGQGYYAAMRDVFLREGTRLGSARAYRTPTIFLLWQRIPASLLYVTFLVVVVGLTSALLVFCTRRPALVIPVTCYLLLAGRTPGGMHGVVESWMLVEEWTVPLIAGCLLACRHKRWWLAAVLAGVAAVSRELMFPLLLAGLLAAQVRGLPRKPWIVATVGSGGLFALHTFVAGKYVLAHGNEAALMGTGRFPASILGITAWCLPGHLAAGAVLWALAVVHACRVRAAVWPVAVVLGLPLVGVLVNRPYWGLLMIPFAILWAGEELADLVTKLRNAGSSARPCAEDPALTG